MEETMTWILIGTATLCGLALGVLNAWLLLKFLLKLVTKNKPVRN